MSDSHGNMDVLWMRKIIDLHRYHPTLFKWKLTIDAGAFYTLTISISKGAYRISEQNKTDCVYVTTEPNIIEQKLSAAFTKMVSCQWVSCTLAVRRMDGCGNLLVSTFDALYDEIVTHLGRICSGKGIVPLCSKQIKPNFVEFHECKHEFH